MTCLSCWKDASRRSRLQYSFCGQRTSGVSDASYPNRTKTSSSLTTSKNWKANNSQALPLQQVGSCRGNFVYLLDHRQDRYEKGRYSRPLRIQFTGVMYENTKPNTSSNANIRKSCNVYRFFHILSLPSIKFGLHTNPNSHTGTCCFS